MVLWHVNHDSFLSLRVFGLLSSSSLLFPQHFGRYVLRPSSGVCCLNFRDEACWFLSLRLFGLLSSSLLLFPQHFGRYVLRPSSGVCRTREPTRNFELRPLLNPRGSPVLIPLAITGYSYATQKLMLDSCKMVEKLAEAFHTFLWHFFQV